MPVSEATEDQQSRPPCLGHVPITSELEKMRRVTVAACAVIEVPLCGVPVNSAAA
jgi:hypothetical protein